MIENYFYIGKIIMYVISTRDTIVVLSVSDAERPLRWTLVVGRCRFTWKLLQQIIITINSRKHVIIFRLLSNRMEPI